MKNSFLLISLVFSFFVFGTSAFSLSNDMYVVVLPGYFYFTINGGLQEGVNLVGLKPADSVTNQVGYWNGDNNLDYLFFYDSSGVPGFRIQMYLDGDFIYYGSHADQGNIVASNFKIFSKWDSVGGVGLPPTIGLDNSFFTLNIASGASCKPDELLPYSDYYTFHGDFSTNDYSVSFANLGLNYLSSTNSCKNEGKISIGRFQLDLGVVKAGEYRSSLYIIMLDGY